MKRTELAFGLMIVAIAIITAGTVSASNYTIDGCMKDDWGVNLSEDWNSVKTWVPASSTCHWIVEDNIDLRYYKGIHIAGKGDRYSYYKEPKIIMWKKGWLPHSYKQPYHERRWSARSRELNDIEAMYCDTNATHAFVAIVTSIPIDTVMSDLAIDSNGDDHNYEYGIVLNGKDRGKIYKNPEWSKTDKFKNSGPYRITGGTFIGTANIEYEDQYIFDFGKTNWVIEIGMPKINITKLHATLLCGNDVVEVIPTKPSPSPSPIPTLTPMPTLSPTPTITPSPIPTSIPSPPPPEEEIPEFSTIAIPIVATIGIFYYLRKKQKNN